MNAFSILTIQLLFSNQVVADTEIEGNVPLTLNYGCLDNDLFLLDYGFVIPSNQYDYIELKYDEALLEAASIVAGISSGNFSSPAPWQKLVLTKLNLHGEAALLKVLISLNFISLPLINVFL